jgi:hypothetical protein
MREKQVKLVLVLMNWISSNPELYTSEGEDQVNRPALDQINYWCTRLSPLMQPLSSSSNMIASNTSSSKIYVITCNRIGTERGKMHHANLEQ